MHKLKCTDNITKLATIPMAMDRYKIGRKTLMIHAKDADAIIRFGKSVRIDIDKMDSYISRNNSEKR